MYTIQAILIKNIAIILAIDSHRYRQLNKLSDINSFGWGEHGDQTLYESVGI